MRHFFTALVVSLALLAHATETRRFEEKMFVMCKEICNPYEIYSYSAVWLGGFECVCASSDEEHFDVGECPPFLEKTAQ